MIKYIIEKGDIMSILIMLVLLSILILVHEFGHFITARMFGIKVEKFGFGLPIGPTLFQKIKYFHAKRAFLPSFL